MSDILPYVTAAGVIIGVIVTLLNYRASRAARLAAEKASSGLVEIGGKVYDLGAVVDGRLSQLLAATAQKAAVEAHLARAEGKAEGEQAQRDRSSEAQP